MKKHFKKVILVVCILLFISSVSLASLFYFGILHINNPSAGKYPVRGVDVSAYQGDIDWSVLSKDITFAFIKATEGSSFVDKKFQTNWTAAGNEDIYAGAYHFFSFESEGSLQAKHFISTVGSLGDSHLPPVIDIEYYGYKGEITEEKIRGELEAMVRALEEYYGVSPILYVTKESYNDFVKGDFEGCPLWVRSVYEKPDYIDEDKWSFWQYSNRHRLDGYDGDEPYIDMNLYNGDMDAFTRQFALSD